MVLVRPAARSCWVAAALLVAVGLARAQPAPSQVAPQPPAAVSPALRPARGQPAPAQGGSFAAAPAARNADSGRWMLMPAGSTTWVPAGYELPPVLPYREGQPVPAGYHLEERPSRGALTTGYLLTGIPYDIGLIAAFSGQFA